jgi:hypothetical protein
MLTIYPAAALAEASQARQTLTAQSESMALAAQSVTIYQSLPGPGRDVALQKISAKMHATLPHVAAAIDSAATETTVDDDTWTVLKGDGWLMNVRGDGDKIGFIVSDAVSRGQSKRIALTDAPRLADLEPRARDFIKSTLTDVVPLQANEGLVAWRTLQSVGTEMSDGGRSMNQYVGATQIEFRRTIDGIVVLGPGSRVSVTFAADGSVAAFDVDWSRFKSSGKKAKTVDRSTIRSRVAAQRATRGALASSVQVADRPLECGYYDAGADKHGRSLVPACISAYTQFDQRTKDKSGFFDVIPLDPSQKGALNAPDRADFVPPSGP